MTLLISKRALGWTHFHWERNAFGGGSVAFGGYSDQIGPYDELALKNNYQLLLKDQGHWAEAGYVEGIDWATTQRQMWAGIVVGEAGGLVGSQLTNVVRNSIRNAGLESKAISTRISAASADADSEAGSPALVRSNVEANAASGNRLNSQLIAEEIVNGHAYQKHAVEKGEFTDLGIATKAQIQELFENIVANPSVERRKAVDGTTYCLDSSTKTVVIRGQRGELLHSGLTKAVLAGKNYLKSQVPKKRVII